jgi:MoxR-like ATPase
MNHSQVVESVKECYEARLSLLITGAPGVGKSSAVRQAALELGIALVMWL